MWECPQSAHCSSVRFPLGRGIVSSLCCVWLCRHRPRAAGGPGPGAGCSAVLGTAPPSCPWVPASSARAVLGSAVPCVLPEPDGWDRCRPRSICALLAPLVGARDLISCLHLLSPLFISSFSKVCLIFKFFYYVLFIFPGLKGEMIV